MSVEGMWKFQSTSVGAPNTFQWGGIVVLETGRVFGGDSIIAYLGTYELSGDVINARVRAFSWNHTVQGVNVFGMPTPMDYVVILQGQRQGEAIAGILYPELQPSAVLKVRMEKLAELP